MNARIAPQHLDGLSRQGRMMIEMLVLSAQSLTTDVERNAAGGQHERGEFTRLVRQLMAQRQLVGEILDSEVEYGDYDYEIANLRRSLENICLESEYKVLGVQAGLARGAGKEGLAARIEAFLPNGAPVAIRAASGFHVI